MVEKQKITVKIKPYRSVIIKCVTLRTADTGDRICENGGGKSIIQYIGGILQEES